MAGKQIWRWSLTLLRLASDAKLFILGFTSAELLFSTYCVTFQARWPYILSLCVYYDLYALSKVRHH